MDKQIQIIIIAALLVLSCGLASAHRIHVSTQIGEISVKSWIGGGSPVKEGDVKVYMITEGVEELYLEGTTDLNGEFGFPPKIGVKEYRIVVEPTDLPGHKAETILNMTQLQSCESGEGMPTYLGVISGLGYLAGLAGLSSMWIYRKKQKK